jgi:transcriptional regulator with XRE-family HTH domain
MGHEAMSQKAVAAPDPLGTRLRDRRQFLGLTLKEVADEAGLSVGFISQIERGITLPSLSSLVSVCHVLKSDVGNFLTQPRGDKQVTRHDERPHYALGADTISYERLSAAFPGNVLRSIIVNEPSGHRMEPMTHEGEEMFYVLEGSVTAEVDGKRTVLEPGDSIHFPSTMKHSIWNHMSTHAKLLWVGTMDLFGDGTPAFQPDTHVAVSRANGRNSGPRPQKIKSASKPPKTTKGKLS